MNPVVRMTDQHNQTRPSVFCDGYPEPGPSWCNAGYSASAAYSLGYSLPEMVQQQAFSFNASPELQNGQYQFCGNQKSPTSPTTAQFPFVQPQQMSMEPNDCFAGRFSHGKIKRKADSPPPFPSKQLITEEKMTEHMSRLNISSESPSSSHESDQAKSQRLYMCEEMRKLQNEPLLPPTLLRVPRPCTALVLWQPPIDLSNPTREERYQSLLRERFPAANNRNVRNNRVDVQEMDNNNDEGAVDLMDGNMDFDL